MKRCLSISSMSSTEGSSPKRANCCSDDEDEPMDLEDPGCSSSTGASKAFVLKDITSKLYGKKPVAIRRTGNNSTDNDEVKTSPDRYEISWTLSEMLDPIGIAIVSEWERLGKTAAGDDPARALQVALCCVHYGQQELSEPPSQVSQTSQGPQASGGNSNVPAPPSGLAQSIFAQANTSNSGPSTRAPRAGSKFYAVAKGNKVGIFTDWFDAKDATEGYKGAEYKKFDTLEEAEEFVARRTKANQESRQSTLSFHGLPFAGSLRNPILLR